MQTHFSDHQLQDAAVREANRILRSCVHCGFCTATCPTFVLLGDELDSPRGRISLIKEMLEKDVPASPTVVRHVDRCLTCLSCMTTCPSGVDYHRLVSQARSHIERTARRPLADRLLRWALRLVLPYPARFRIMVSVARRFGSVVRVVPGQLGRRLTSMVQTAARHPVRAAGPASRPGRFAPAGTRRMRVALLGGCVQSALDPDINEATVRLLSRLGAEVIVPVGQGCCGALSSHMGVGDDARTHAIRNLRAWAPLLDQDGGLDAVVSTASGCGLTLKDYGHLLGDDPQWAETARRIAAVSRDVSEVIARLLDHEDGPTLSMAKGHPGHDTPVAYHAACSLQHGQKIHDLPQTLLRHAGFTVVEPAEAHLCCGSAGTYAVLQPDLSGQLRDRKAAAVLATGAAMVATGNIGCIKHLSTVLDIPVVHTVQVLDWAMGGPSPIRKN